MLLRNLNQAEGLCNGTRLMITMLGSMIIEGEIMSGTHKGKSIRIPRISLILKNNILTFILQRHHTQLKSVTVWRLTKVKDKHCKLLVSTCKNQFLRMVNYTLQYHE
jgi:ATP-dependent DNA helicase PIF1